MSLGSTSIESQFNINPDNSSAGKSYEFEEFRLEAPHLMLYQNGKELELPPKVVETLLALVEKRGEIVSKEELMTRLWKDSFVEESNLTQNIYLLRKILGDAANGKPLIETFRRRGYRFNGQVKIVNEVISEASSAQTKTQITAEESEPSPEGPAARPSVRSIVNRQKGKSRLFFGALAVGGLLLLIVPGILYYFYREKQITAAVLPAPQTISLKRLTPQLFTYAPALSPDGKWIAYGLVEEGGQSLWLKEMSSGRTTQFLPKNPKAYRYLAFSPDSLRLYYLTKNNVLARIPVSGGESEEIVREVTNPFTFSPDGRQVAFVRGSKLFIANTDGSGERVLSERDGEAKWYSSFSSQPSWSPDGRRIVISGGSIELGQKSPELIEVTVENGAERRIQTPPWEEIDDVLWFPDGTGLLVTARETITAPSQIWHLSYPDVVVSRVTNDLHSYNWLALSADERLLVTAQSLGGCNIWMAPFSDMSRLEKLTSDDRETTGRSGLAVAPGGKIIFTSEYSGNLDLWQMNTDGSQLKQLTANAADWNARQQITGDGQYIVFVSTRAGKRNIWRINADGSNPLQLTAAGHEDYPSISPDSQWVYYNDLTGSLPAIRKVSINGGETVQISGDYAAASPSVSPDGKLIAYFHGEKKTLDWSKVGLLPVEGGAPLRLFDVAAFREIVRWTPDGKSLIFIQKGSQNLWQQPIDGGAASQLTNFDIEKTWNFAISSDGQKIVLARGNATTESVLITNFR